MNGAARSDSGGGGLTAAAGTVRREAREWGVASVVAAPGWERGADVTSRNPMNPTPRRVARHIPHDRAW
jgi:hypothetical protein